MTRPIFEHDVTRKPLHAFRRQALSALCAAAVICAAAPAMAAGQLAVGEVIPLEPPPGYAFRPVYTPPVLHSRWEPADSFGGRVFREPIYTTPPGYVYRYVRGYTRVRVAYADRPVRKVAVRNTTAKRTGACVTELGYGRYQLCP
jgi:hypothetical protein